MRFGTWKCLTRALPPRSPKYSSKHRLCDLQRLCEVRCSSLACWSAMGAWKLEARCFALGGQPLNVGSCKARFCGCLGSDKGCSQDTISIQFWLIQWQINLGIFSVQIENSILTHDTDSLALVATAGLGPTNIALNMAWDCANTIKTISESVFFLLRVSWKNTRLMSWEFMGKRYIGNAICEVFDIFCAKPSSLGNGQKHCKNQCFCPTKTTKTIPQWLEDDLQIFSDSCAIHLRGFNPAESLSLIKMNWCYYPNQHICQRRCPDFIPYWDKLILLPQSTYVPERVPGVYPFLR